MGLIIPFLPAAQKSPARTRTERQSTGADILFFTGVRYDRRETGRSGNDGDRPHSGSDRSQNARQRRRKASRS